MPYSTAGIVLTGTIPLPGNNHNQKHYILQHPGKPLESFCESEEGIKYQSWNQLFLEQKNGVCYFDHSNFPLNILRKHIRLYYFIYLGI